MSLNELVAQRREKEHSMPQTEQEIKEAQIKAEADKAPKTDETVSKDAYLAVSNDMHKYKSELKEMKATVTQMQADKQAIENEKLAEQGRWEDLYKGSQEKLKEATTGRQAEADKFVNFHKKNSVLTKLGGFKNEEYNSFINVEAVNLNEDGSIDQPSLDLEVNRIKQSYPELLKGAQATKLPNEAPQRTNFGDKDYKDMTPEEKSNYRREQIKKP